MPTIVSRRTLLNRCSLARWASAPAAGFRSLAQALAADPQRPPALHPAVDDRRADADRHVRHEAGPRQRRRVQGNRDQVPRACGSASTCPSWPRWPIGWPCPQPEHQGRRPRPRHVRVRTGHKPKGPFQYPSIGSSLALQMELGTASAGLPDYVSVAPYRAFNQDAFWPGFLGPRYGPLTVGAADVRRSIANRGRWLSAASASRT